MKDAVTSSPQSNNNHDGGNTNDLSREKKPQKKTNKQTNKLLIVNLLWRHQKSFRGGHWGGKMHI